MGEYADMILDGTIDEVTGEFIDGESPGYPRRIGEAKPKFACDSCDKRFASSQGLSDHKRDVHQSKQKGR